MEQLVQQILEFILALRGPVVYAVVGFLTWAEAAFFLGLVTPGELAMAVGGVLASRGQVSAVGVAAAAAAGTVLGNTTGYWLGRRWGPAVLGWAPVQRFLGRSVRNARSFFDRRGEWGIVVGQFVSYVRIFVPFLAGASGVSVRRFLAYGVPTAVVWSVAWVAVGVGLGESWRMLRDVAGPASFLVLALFLLALAIRRAALWIARRKERFRALARWVLTRAPVLRARRLTGALLGWLGERFDPRVARGLNVTLGFLVLLAGSAVVGIVVHQVENARGIARIDVPALQWMAATRTEAAVEIARGALEAFRVPGFLAPAALGAAWAWWRVGWTAAARVILGLVGAGLGAHLLDERVLHGVVPRAGYPSVPVAVAAGLMVHATAVVGARRAWGGTVAAAAVGLFLACAVALAALVAGWAAPSGIALGFGLGLAWSTVLELPARLGGRPAEA